MHDLWQALTMDVGDPIISEDTDTTNTHLMKSKAKAQVLS